MPDRSWLGKFRSVSYGTVQRERITIPKFGYQEAFELAALTKKIAKEEFSKRPVIIDISLPNGYSLLRIGTDVGSALHDDCWIQSKQMTAMGFGRSSFIMGGRCGVRPAWEAMQFLRSKKYTFDGGALPIFIDSCEYAVACLTISGLQDYENHWLAVESVRDYLAEIKANESKSRYRTGEEICSICLSEVPNDSQFHVTPCNHIFHSQCLNTWTNHRPQCPVCRSAIPEAVRAGR